MSSKRKFSKEGDAAAEAFADRVEELSGIPYPPRNAAELTVLLTRAGFSDERIESTLATLEYPGFEDCPRLPRGYVSTSEASGSHPIFSARLIAGLERWNAQQDDGESEKLRELAEDALCRSGIALAALRCVWGKKRPVSWSTIQEFPGTARDRAKFDPQNCERRLREANTKLVDLNLQFVITKDGVMVKSIED